MREKLIEQRVKDGAESICDKCIHGKVCRAIDNQPCIECNQFADANGVTIAKDNNVPSKWIPVTERLPTEEDASNGDYVFAYNTNNKVIIATYQDVIRFRDFVKCWTHLPQPPKGE